MIIIIIKIGTGRQQTSIYKVEILMQNIEEKKLTYYSATGA